MQNSRVNILAQHANATSINSFTSSEVYQTTGDNSNQKYGRALASMGKRNPSRSSLLSTSSKQLKEAMKPMLSEKNGIRRGTEIRALAIAKFRMIKFNSTSTLFVDTTMVNADLRESLR